MYSFTLLAQLGHVCNGQIIYWPVLSEPNWYLLTEELQKQYGGRLPLARDFMIGRVQETSIWITVDRV